jgi:hypothetical protein
MTNDAVLRALHAQSLPSWPGRSRPEWLPLGPTTGGYDQLTQRFYEGFPDACFAVEDVIAQGDWVVIRYSLTATQAASPRNAVGDAGRVLG